jgi:uncharacterized protein YjbJ (UPF0337 family)
VSVAGAGKAKSDSVVLQIERRPRMGDQDKMNNKIEDIRGQAKEQIGKATGDEELEAQGRGDQAKSDLKQAGEKVKDAFKN